MNCKASGTEGRFWDRGTVLGQRDGSAVPQKNLPFPAGVFSCLEYIHVPLHLGQQNRPPMSPKVKLFPSRLRLSKQSGEISKKLLTNCFAL